MKYIEKILEQLKDSEWHTTDEIKNKNPLTADALNKVLFFLYDMNFIDKKNEKLKITSKGLKFLELPH
jgi:predicted transcriptional regulator